MNALLLLFFSLLMTLPSFAAVSCKIITSKQQCYVWIGDSGGNFIDRINIDFSLSSTCDASVNAPFENEIPVHRGVVAKITSDWNHFRLSLQDVDGIVLESADFKHSERSGDYQGINAYTQTGQYTLACASMDE